MSASTPPPPDARWRPLALLIPVGALCILVAGLCPDEGWTVAGKTVRVELPAIAAGWLTPEPSTAIIPQWKPEDVQALLDQYDEQLASVEALDSASASASVSTPDSSAAPLPADTLDPGSPATPSAAALKPDTGRPASAPAERPGPVVSTSPPTGTAAGDWIPGSLRIRIPEQETEAFHRLFARLKAGEPVQVLHYGDSQIEGDRISGTLRKRWQDRWGGYGPGIQPPIPLVQSFALTQRATGSWKRHTRFGRRDTTDLDENYGLLASYATADTLDGPACIAVGRERRSPAGFGRWDHLALTHDSVHAPCVIRVDGEPVDTLIPGSLPGTLILPGTAMDAGLDPIEVCFDGLPPRLFSLHPVGAGVQWHSVAMRGASGTLFRKLDRAPFSRQLHDIGPDLIVLQFGGNTVPYTRDTAAAERYGGWFERQIQLFQALAPTAAILVIGPSDMAQKTGLDWTPFPLLDAVRVALREASLDAGVAHWDLLDAMGGLGSMPAWVSSTPPLAGPDHVHFTPRGARQVGEWLDRALWAEYRRWERGGNTPAMTGMKPRSSSPILLQPAADDGE